MREVAGSFQFEGHAEYIGSVGQLRIVLACSVKSAARNGSAALQTSRGFGAGVLMDIRPAMLLFLFLGKPEGAAVLMGNMLRGQGLPCFGCYGVRSSFDTITRKGPGQGAWIETRITDFSPVNFWRSFIYNGL